MKQTIKITYNNSKEEYLYHGGALRSHILYAELDDIKTFDRMNMSERELDQEIKRVKKLLGSQGTTEIIDIPQLGN